MNAKTAKPATVPAAAPSPRPGTREYRDAQRAEFNRKIEAAKKRQK